MHIKTLKLYTTQLNLQTQFYSEILGLEVLERSATSVSFKIGNSVLQFEYKEGATPYHFALNIPSYKEQEALEWLKQRVGILKRDEDEIQDFNAWNARAIYFYDADKNIVEFISRRNLKQESHNPFSSQDVLEISEIGMVVKDIEQVFNTINQQMELSVYGGDFTDFCAIGGEQGLFICIIQERHWFPQNDHAYISNFEIETIHNEQVFNLQFKNGSIQYI